LPNVIPPPAKFQIDPFYTKFTWAREFPVIGRGANDRALLKANDTIRKMFAYRHDILKALIHDGVRLAVLGKDERLADLPGIRSQERYDLLRFLEYSPEAKLIVVDEQNVLGNPADPLVGDCQIIRLFAKAFYDVCGSRPVDPNWEKRGRAVQQYELRVPRLDVRFGQRVQEALENARSRGLWKGTGALRDPSEYWARGVLAYFDAAGQGHAPEDAPHPVTTREALRQYDAGLYRLVEETMAYTGRVDWRYD
jgi:hypothetical protein